MKGLFQKVTAGKYPPIPSIYSSDMAGLLKSLLQQNPSLRPSCGTIISFNKPSIEQIQKLPYITKRTEASSEAVVTTVNHALASGEILGTIVLPKNLNILSSRLPKPNYKPSLKKNPSNPGELNRSAECGTIPENSGRKIASSQQQHRPQNPKIGVLVPEQVQQSRAIPSSSPSGEDIVIDRNAKNINNPHKPVIKPRPGMGQASPLPPRIPYLEFAYISH